MELHRLIPFVPAKDYYRSSEFYQAMGFTQLFIAQEFSEMKSNHLSFYLQDFYVKELADNLMFEIKVEHLHPFHDHMKTIVAAFPEAKVSDIATRDHGLEFNIWDPSGVLWVVVAANKYAL
ncbi:MAG: glyoxalase [Erysipelotrichia bacterium]|jgi:hypothetical protein|nr:glyoxalase [Erysipelotrichia bacterium]